MASIIISIILWKIYNYSTFCIAFYPTIFEKKEA